MANASSPALLLNPSATPGGSLVQADAATRVQVHPLVLLSILDHHTRRQEGAGRVIGTLLGRRSTQEGRGDFVEVTNCFAVPHAEHGDEVAIGKDFNRQMLALHTRANRNEVVVGWYATALPPSSEDGGDGASSAAGGGGGGGSDDERGYKCIADTSSLIHEFYAGECARSPVAGSVAVADGSAGDPIHLVVDTSLTHDTMGVKAFKSTPVTVRGEPFANMFHEIQVRITSNESERICVDKMIQALGGEEADQRETNGGKDAAIVEDEDPTKSLEVSMTRLLELLETASEYVNKIVDGSVPMPTDDAVGRQLYDALASVPRVRREIFDDMFHDNLQDLLMVSYLSNLTKTQLVIAEKLNETLTLAI